MSEDERRPEAGKEEAGEKLRHAVEEHRERKERYEAQSEHSSVAQLLGMAGSIGWLIVAPTLLGIVLGRLLDRHWAPGGIFWTATLTFVGVSLGSYLAWRRIHLPPPAP